MKTTKEKIEVMQAFERGKKIQETDVLNPHESDWYDQEDPSWNWSRHCDYRLAPIPESKAEQEEKDSEGKLDDQSPKSVSPRSEPFTATECRESLAKATFPWESQRGVVERLIASIEKINRDHTPQTDTQVNPAEKPSPSPKTKRVPLTKSHFDGQAVIWVTWGDHNNEWPIQGIEYDAMKLHGSWLGWKELCDGHAEYSFDRVNWHPFFVEVADE